MEQLGIIAAEGANSFFDAEGNKVAEARMTGVETERPPEEG